MKVLFMADVGDAAGIGGHLYTVQALAEALASRIERVVVSVGGATSPALEALDCPKYKLAFGTGRWRRRERERFVQIVRAEKPDVIHAFDPVSCAFARMAARRCGCGWLLTQCGGPNPVGRHLWAYFPRVPRLVVLSQENERFFRETPRFRKTRVWRIPNRINEVAPDSEKIGALRNQLDPERPVLLRVSRISPSYGRTAEMCIRLVKRLAADGVPAQLVFLGVVHDEPTAKALRDELGDLGRVISDPELVAQASSVLDVGDLVVGTGRGLMEAAARGRIILVPARSGRLPALVNEKNWESLFRANFSERSEVQPWDEERNYADIRDVLQDSAARRRRAEFSRKLYEEQFALGRVVERYLAIYEEARGADPRQVVDEAKHWLWMLLRTWNRPSVPAGAQ